MGLPVTVYRWDDAGAPQLNTQTPGEIIAILKACLVDGYGTKQALGWTMPYEDSNATKAVFKNNMADGGSGGYVQFWAKNGADTAKNVVQYQTAKLMTALDTFTPDLFYNGLSAGSDTNDQWVIIGTSRGFFLIISNSVSPDMTTRTQRASTLFFGDYDPVVPSDQNTFCATYYASADNINPSWDTSLDYMSDNWGYMQLLDLDNSGNIARHVLRNFFYSTGIFHLADASKSLGVANVPLMFIPIVVQLYGASSGTQDPNGVYINQSTVRPAFRGVIPGLHGLSVAAYADQPWPTIITQGSDSFWLIRQGHLGACSLCISLGEWYA